MTCPHGWHVGPLQVHSNHIVCMACTEKVTNLIELEHHQRLRIAVSQIKLDTWASIALRQLKQARLPPPR